MDRVAALAVLIACYRPAHELPCTIACTTDCPAGLTCIDGLCRQADGSCGGGDAAPGDVPRDSLDAAAAPCVLGSFTHDTMYMPGLDYATGGAKSVYAASFTDDDIWETTADSAGVGSRIPAAVFAGYGALWPRLAPSGDELFFIGNQGGTYELMRSRADVAGNWQPATTVTVSPAGLRTAALCRACRPRRCRDTWWCRATA